MSYLDSRLHYEMRHFQWCCDIATPEHCDVEDLIGLSQGQDDTSVILTYPHTVQEFKLSKDEPYITKTGEWCTRYKFTSAVTYDKLHQKYIGVFHDLTVRMWTRDVTNLEDTDKYMFRLPILRLFHTEDDNALIIFTNGNCVTLQHGLEHCPTLKARALIKESTNIVDVASYMMNKTDHICYIVKDKNKQYSIITCPIKNEMLDCSKVETVKVHRDIKDGIVNVTAGQIVASTYKYPVVYFTWNDSFISEYDLKKKSWHHRKPNYMANLGNEVAIACTGKRYLMFYRKTSYNGKIKADLFLPHVKYKGCPYHSIPLEEFTKHSKLFGDLNEFILAVESNKIAVYNIYVYYSTSKRTDETLSIEKELLQEVRQVEKIPPVFNISKMKLWNRMQSANRL